MVKEVRTEDGSLTLFSEKFREPYHSVTAGALTEAVEKFCKPCRIRERAKSGEVNLLDVCFGLGYNTVAFINEALSENPKARLKIVSFEFDISVIEKSFKLDWKEFNRWKWVLREALKNRRCEKSVLVLSTENPQIQLKIYITEGRKFLKALSCRYENFADAVFHDPFSPKVNPELWTYEFFKGIRRMTKETGILATYSTSTAVRRALHMAGFGVREGVAVGRKSRSTVASPTFKTEEKLLEKFKLPTSVPFRDPTLSDSSELIRYRREGCIKLLSRSLPLEVLY